MPEDADTGSSLDALRRKLYDRNAGDAFAVPVLTKHAPEHSEGWVAPPEAPKRIKKKGLPLSVKFLIGTGVFFFLAILVAAYVLIFGTRSVSTDNIHISVQGSTSVASGDTVPLAITIDNKNPVAITVTNLSVIFPDSTRSADDKTEPFARYDDQNIGEIAAGQSTTRTVSAVLFGTQGQKVSIPVKIEYRTPGSNSVFVKDATYDFTITTSPISITATALSQVPSGQKFSIQVTVHSNATAPLQNIAVFANYPSGFIASNASSTGPLFMLGTLAPSEEKQFLVSGSLIGQDGDERIFTFTTGIQPDASKKEIATPYATAVTDLRLAKPFLATTLAFNRDTSDAPVIPTGIPVDAELSWVNALTSLLSDGQIIVSLKGSVLDTSSIRATGGYYRSSDTSVLFNKDTSSSLGALNPGGTGGGSFSFETKPGSALANAGVKNPTLSVTVSASGRRTTESNVPEILSSTIVRTIQVGTDLGLTSRAVRTTGPFTNTGPIPPKVDQETLYTLYLTLTNTVNSVGGATVTATLPAYVRFTGMVSPSDGSFTYTDATRTVTWNAGDVPAGTGYASTPAREMAFQVALLPSLSQKGTSPILLSPQSLTGTDRFTKKTLNANAPALTTNTATDPKFKLTDESVTQ